MLIDINAAINGKYLSYINKLFPVFDIFINSIQTINTVKALNFRQYYKVLFEKLNLQTA